VHQIFVRIDPFKRVQWFEGKVQALLVVEGEMVVKEEHVW